MDNFPNNFTAQINGIEDYSEHVEKGGKYLVKYFREHPNEASTVLAQSYDKRYSPSTFIEEVEDKYQVGWFEKDRRNVLLFNTIEDAVADYLLFSFGVGRYEQ